MDEPLERMLEAEVLEPPPDFLERVMREIEQRPKPPVPTAPPAWLGWAAAVAAVAFGVAQIFAFTFSVWITAAVE